MKAEGLGLRNVPAVWLHVNCLCKTSNTILSSLMLGIPEVALRFDEGLGFGVQGEG